MDYLEEIRFNDLSNVTLYDAKEEILSYEEFAGIKEEGMREKEQEQEMAGYLMSEQLQHPPAARLISIQLCRAAEAQTQFRPKLQ